MIKGSDGIFWKFFMKKYEKFMAPRGKELLYNFLFRRHKTDAPLYCTF